MTVRKDLPAHAISTKNKHLLVIYSIPARGFTAAVSVFWGTPPPKPSNCKSVSNHPGPPARPRVCGQTVASTTHRWAGARLRPRWADPTGEEFVLLGAISVLLRPTSSRRRLAIVHSRFTFRCLHSPPVPGKQKTLLTRGKQGEEILFDSLPAHLRIVQARFGTLPTIRPGWPKAKRTAGVQPAMTCRFRDRHGRPNRG